MSLYDYRRCTTLRLTSAAYDFATDGGALGNLDLDLSTEIPAGSYVTHGYVVVATVPTSAGAATLALTLLAPDDTVPASALSASPWVSRGRHPIAPPAHGFTATKSAAAQATVRLTIGAAALTAGAWDLVLYYATVPTPDPYCC